MVHEEWGNDRACMERHMMRCYDRSSMEDCRWGWRNGNW